MENIQRTVSEQPAGYGRELTDGAMPFWSLMAFTFILFISPQSFLPFLAPLHLALVSASMAVLAYLYDRLSQRQPVMEFTRENVVVLCLLGWALFTLPLSYWPGGSIGVLTGQYLKTLIVFWLLSYVINNVIRLQRIVWALTLMAVPISLTALAHFVMGDFIQPGIAADESRIQGYGAPLTGNPNDLALTLNLFLPLSVALFLGSKTAIVRLALLFCTSLSAIAIITTFSRAGFLTLFATLVTYLLMMFKRQQRRWVFLVVFLVIAVVPFLPAGYLDRLSTISNIDTDPTGSAQTRWGDTLAAIKYVASHPVIGAGMGMDALALNKVRGPTWTPVHDAYLECAVDLGLPGLILFLMLMTAVINKMRAVKQNSSASAVNKNLYHLAEGIRISLVAFSIAAFFHPVAYHFYFYFIAGLALATGKIFAMQQADSGLFPHARGNLGVNRYGMTVDGDCVTIKTAATDKK